MLLPALLLSLARAAGAPDAPTPAAGLDARSFGAVGDGLADDGPALQLAINESQRLGRALLLPAGRYLVNRTLVVQSDARGHPGTNPLRLVGEGQYLSTIVAGR